MIGRTETIDNPQANDQFRDCVTELVTNADALVDGLRIDSPRPIPLLESSFAGEDKTPLSPSSYVSTWLIGAALVLLALTGVLMLSMADRTGNTAATVSSAATVSTQSEQPVSPPSVAADQARVVPTRGEFAATEVTPPHTAPVVVEHAVAAEPPATFYTVRPGDSLTAIARDFYGDIAGFQAIYQANTGQIDDPEIVFAGSVIVIPDRAD